MLIVFLKALVIGFSIAMPVGPIGAMCIKNSLSNGFVMGFAVGLGAAFADSFYGLLAGGGLAFISQFLLDHLNGIKIVGGSILVYLGIKEIRLSKRVQLGVSELNINGFIRTSAKVFLLTLTNPATILLFVGIFASISNKVHLDAIGVFIMVAGIFFGSLLWWLILSYTVSVVRHKISNRLMTKINMASPILPIGAKSLTVSKPTLGNTCGLITKVPSKPKSKV